jgi:uncharacterized protein YbaP (TraB family)
MIRLRTSLLLAVVAAASACKSEKAPAARPPADPITQSGSAKQAPRGEPDPWMKQAPSEAPLAHPLLWSVEKDGTATYFLGTMHLGVEPDRLPKLVWSKFDAAPTFAMETDLADPSIGDMQRPAGKHLHAELSDAEWKKLEQALTPDVAQRLDALKPMVAATMLSMRGLPMTAPMDGVLLGRAKNQHKQLVYLEPAAKEEALLEKWMDMRALKDMLDDLELGQQRAKDMLAAYVAGDDHKLLALADSERDEWLKRGHDPAEYEREMDEMLYDRNASWIAPIEKLHAAGGGFVATGALHLVGKRSVLDLLAAKGYKVTRLTP